MTPNADPAESSSTRIARLEGAVAELQRRVATLERERQQHTAPIADVAPDPWSVPPWPDVVRLISAGKKIEAIKVYREHAGVGLKEAKDVVDEVASRMP